MDYFNLLMDGISITGQAVMHMIFISRMLGKKLRLWHFAVYLTVLGIIQLVSSSIAVNSIFSIGTGVTALYLIGRFFLRSQRLVSWLAAVLAFYISQMSFGIINSLEAVIFPRFIGSPLLYLLLFAMLVLFFILCIFCYYAALKLMSWTEDKQTPYIGLLLFPGLFFFAAELYILHSAYSFFAPSVSLEEIGKHSVLLFLQILGLAAMLCTLYAYRYLCQGLHAQSELRSLSQASEAQKIYIKEARQRYEQTRSFRHDIRNHLSVLDGLLRNGKTDEGREYLKKLEAVSGALSFPYQTGNAVVDILLGEKLGLAEGVSADVSLVLPSPCGIDDFDLCVIFANALDNAITACRSGNETQSIRISGKQQGDFYMLIFENTCPDEPMPLAGTGLSNIKAAAEKYHGAVLTEKSNGQFSLNVLLNIS